MWKVPYSSYSLRDVWDVFLVGDATRPVIEACSSGNVTALQSLLTQSRCVAGIFEAQQTIDPQERSSMAVATENLVRALETAALNGHAAAVSTLISFAKEHGVDTTAYLLRRSSVYEVIERGHAEVFRALAIACPRLIDMPLQNSWPLLPPIYDAVKLRQPDVVAVMLELMGGSLRELLGGFRNSLLSWAAMGDGPRTVEMLLAGGLDVEGTAALHSAAVCGQISTMRLLLQHGADVDEVVGWKGWTPLHFAASEGQVDAMEFLEQSGARSDAEDKNGKTPAQLLEEHRNAAANG